LLPAQVGVGQLILEAKPTVVPVFINGLSNDFFGQMVGNFTGRRPPIVMVFGQPLQMELDGLPKRLRTQKEIAERVLDEIRRLGEKERAIRADLTRS
jgi:1-acyl-sn-glycerol-3-phosphate acyltransferase